MLFWLILLLFLAILPIASIILIITAIVKHNKSGETKPSLKLFEKTIRSLYVYLVLICSLCLIFGGVIYLFNSTLDLALPDKKYTESYDDEMFVDYNSSENVDRAKNRNIIGIFTSSAMLITGLPLFIGYNKIAKKNN